MDSWTSLRRNWPETRASIMRQEGPTGYRQFSQAPSNYNPFRPGKILLWSSIGACAAVFAAWRFSASATPVRPSSGRGWFGASKPIDTTHQMVKRILVENFLLSQRHIAAGKYWTLLTSTFSHQDMNHFLFNMFSLHAFSSVIIHAVRSPWHLGALMLGSALSGSVGYLYNASRSHSGVNTYALGASGMVMGIGMAAAMLRPKSPMLIFGVVPAPLWAILTGYVAVDSFYLDHPQSRIGHAAHLGGAAFGAVYYAVVLRRFGGIFSAFRR